jgi:MFS family permease
VISTGLFKTRARWFASGGFPPGVPNAFLFAIFNAFSFQIVLSGPMVLYAKTLGASATVLGIIAGMMPLLVIFQIPAANYVARVGYKQFVYAGWGTRVMFIFGMALVPLTAVFLSPPSQLALLLFLLFGFNLSRGISSCAWLPWITSLVPENIRGKYLVWDAACVNLASFFTFILAAFCLGQHPDRWQFAVLFAFSAAMGLVSLSFLKQIPEVQSPEEVKVSTTAVPWKEIATYAPFRKLLVMNLVWSVAYGGLTTFVVAFLRSELQMVEQTILLVTASSFIGGWSSLWFLGARVDRWGSRPVLILSFLTWMAIMLGWMGLAGRILNPHLVLILVLEFLIGLAGATVNLATLRLAMAIIPVMGRNHFFALYSVVGNLTQGIAPILWGLLIDALQKMNVRWGRLEWNRYSVFFCAVLVVFGCALVTSRKLDEPKAAKMEALLREMLLQPLRFWLRFWPRG